MMKPAMSPHVDLNLFRVFVAVMQNRTVSGASRDLGVTASAVSHALARLRKALDDELFTPTYCGMDPTARAVNIHSSISAALATLDAISSPEVFAHNGREHSRVPPHGTPAP